MIILTAAASSTSWILGEGYTEGLFETCVQEFEPQWGPNFRLPFGMIDEVGCRKTTRSSKMIVLAIP